MAFARTKIQRPTRRRGAHVNRPALEQRLGEALLTHRLVLLVAAAGFGKTSALARQCELLPAGTAVAWIACDVDDTPLQLFECLVAALEPFDLPWRTDPASLMRLAAEVTRAEQRRAIATEVVNALDACDVAHGVIVLDDLHRVEHPGVHAFLADLLERLSSRWTFALASRREPPIGSLARLRVQDDVAEFHLDDLRFDADEARTLSAAEGLAPDEADRLHARTQGWPVGLKLALNARRGATAGAHADARAGAIDRHVFDFLADEVIDRLAPPLREFLLRTSVLPELTAARGAALSGDALAAQRLDEIEREGLFASAVTGDEPTLRLHDLFREALEGRLRRERPADHAAALVTAATTEPDPRRRVGWWLRTGRWTEAEAALAASAEELIAAGFADEVQTLFERFPEDLRRTSARLRMTIARIRWNWGEAVEAAAEVARAFADAGDDEARLATLSYRCLALAGANLHAEAREAVQALLREPRLDGGALARTLAASIWMEIPRGDQRAVAPLCSRLVDTLLETRGLSRWNESAPLGPLAGLPGMRAPLERWLQGARVRLADQPTPLRAKCHVIQGWLHLFAGDVDAAQASVDAAADDARWLANPADLDAPWRSLQAVLHAMRGRGDEAYAMLDAIVVQIRSSGVRFRAEVYLGMYLWLGVRCAALRDDAAHVQAYAARLAEGAERRRDWLSPGQLASVPAHVAASDGRLDDACAAWQRIVDDPFHGDLYGQVLESRLRLADARLRLGASPADAAALLAPAFEQVAQAGEWGLVLFAGPAVLRRLADARWGDALAAPHRALLWQWASRAESLAAPAAAAETSGESGGAARGPLATGAGGALTAREVEVLERMAAGDSNKVIARTLDLSPFTVKRHVANILDKLALASRGQAAAWYLAHRPSGRSDSRES
jgi:LuxR family maltose regulon positive regulatory protein